jgi:hypothetical protein
LSVDDADDAVGGETERQVRMALDGSENCGGSAAASLDDTANRRHASIVKVADKFLRPSVSAPRTVQQMQPEPAR